MNIYSVHRDGNSHKSHHGLSNDNPILLEVWKHIEFRYKDPLQAQQQAPEHCKADNRHYDTETNNFSLVETKRFFAVIETFSKDNNRQQVLVYEVVC